MDCDLEEIKATRKLRKNITLEQHIENLKQYIKKDEIIENDNSDFAKFCKGHIEDIQAVLDELNNRIPKEKIRNYLDTRINIVIDDKLNSKDEIQIATDEGVEKLLKMIRQDLLKDKE